MSGLEVIAERSTSVADVVRCADGIVEIRVYDGAIVDVPQMNEILAAQTAIVTGPFAVMVDARKVRSMTRGAQERTAGTASQRSARAVAILVASPVSRLLGNFFVKLARPVYPTRLFGDEVAARRWLLRFSEDRK